MSIKAKSFLAQGVNEVIERMNDWFKLSNVQVLSSSQSEASGYYTVIVIYKELQ